MYRPDQGSHTTRSSLKDSQEAPADSSLDGLPEKQPSESERYAIDEGTDWQRDETLAIGMNQMNQP
jgi:hypothetical protein